MSVDVFLSLLLLLFYIGVKVFQYPCWMLGRTEGPLNVAFYLAWHCYAYYRPTDCKSSSYINVRVKNYCECVL